MALTFPHYFRQAFLGPVVKAAADSERQFRAEVKALSVPVDPRSINSAATRYITAVALMFARQACQAARAGDPHMAVSSIAGYVEDFLRRLSVHVYHDLGGPDLRRGWASWEHFDREMQSTVLDSTGWAEHLAERAAVADPSDVSSGRADAQVFAPVSAATIEWRRHGSSNTVKNMARLSPTSRADSGSLNRLFTGSSGGTMTAVATQRRHAISFWNR